MLSQNHTASFIQFWLTNWLKISKSPDEVVIDDSKALISACVKTFTEYKTVNAYLSACMDVLLFGRDAPNCFIRLDRSHFVATLHRQKAFKTDDPRKRALYLGVFGFLIQCNCFEQIEETVRNIFVLCLQQYITQEVIEAKTRITTIIKEHSFDEEKANNHFKVNDGAETSSERVGDYKSTSNYKWLMTLRNTIPTTKEDSVSAENLYYSPGMESILIQLFVELPLWSNMMCTKFKSSNMCPTSSYSEAEFRNTKSLLNIKTRRPDVFVKKHLGHLSGLLKTGRAEQRYLDLTEENQSLEKERGRSTKRKKRSASLSDVMTEIEISAAQKSRCASDAELNGSRYQLDDPSENWRNKNSKSPRPVQSRRSKYSILDPHDITFVPRSVPVLPNGHSSKMKKDGRIIVAVGTCAIDSIASIYAAAFSDYEDIKQRLNESECSFAIYVRNIFLKCGPKDVESLLDERSQILHKVYCSDKDYYKQSITLDENVLKLDGYTAVSSLVSRLTYAQNHIFGSIQAQTSCETCKTDKNQEVFPLVPVDLRGLQLGDIDSYIMDRVPFCTICSHRLSITREYAPIVAFDVEPQNPSVVKISDIKATINLDNTTFDLYSVIQFNPANRHFLAHIKRRNGLWQTFDDLKGRVQTLSHITNTYMHVFMVFYIKRNLK